MKYYVVPILLVLMFALLAANWEQNSAYMYRNPFMVDFELDDGGRPYDFRRIHKFGETAETTLADDYDIWNCPSLNATIPDAYPYQSSAFTLWASSDDETDAGDTIQVEGLDAAWEFQSVEVTLGADTGSGGTTQALVGSVSNWVRVYRAYVNGSSTEAGNLYFATTQQDADSDGVPDNLANLQACILAGESQTQMALYTTGENEWTWLSQICIFGMDTTAGTPGSGVVGRFRRNEGETFRVQGLYPVHANGTSGICKEVRPPEYLPPRTDLRLAIDTNDNLNRASGTMDFWVIRR